jgi:type I restriction enzyme, S subunit
VFTFSGEDQVASYVVSHLCCVLPKSIDSDFLYYWLKLTRFAHAVDGSTLPYLNLNELAKWPVSLPSLAEQRRIAALLSLVQRAIEQQERLIALTTELKKALMNKLFTEGTRGEPQKQTEIGPIPESWLVVELASVTDNPQYGFTDSASGQGNAQFLRITDIGEFGVNWDYVPCCNCPNNKIDKYLLHQNDIVFTRIGATTGKSYIIKDPPKAVYASYLIRVRATQVLPDYLIEFFQTSAYWRQINSRKDDNLKKGVSGSVLKQLLLPIPTEIEQQEIAAALESCEQKIIVSRKKKGSFSALFRTLLHQLMTAEIRVNDLDIVELGIKADKEQAEAVEL